MLIIEVGVFVDWHALVIGGVNAGLAPTPALPKLS
jgi:hypothetical protein